MSNYFAQINFQIEIAVIQYFFKIGTGRLKYYMKVFCAPIDLI